MSATHISPFAGSWYPEHAEKLRALLTRLFAESRRRTGEWMTPGPVACVVPHAGIEYSGAVAAAAYRTLACQPPEQIVVLAFPHHGALRGVAVPDIGSISTPLGPVELDLEDYPRLAESSLCDHSFEIQLPFLQTAAPRARITPLYVGRLTAEERVAFAATLASRWRPGVVFLASSDFTHYGRDFHYRPFPPDERKLRELDCACIEAAGCQDAGMFLETLDSTGATVCGVAPITLLLETLRLLGGREIYQSTLDYGTSGDVTGDRETTVSYAALAWHRRTDLALAAADGEALLEAAGATLRQLRETGRREAVAARGSAALQARRGAFVTLSSGGDLLGCIGNATGHEPLSSMIPDLALAAALDDPRFRPAARQPGPIDIEISLLTPFRRLRAESDFRLGIDGAVLKWKNRSGLLLPQVAEDHGFTEPRQFLSALARKTVAPPDAWRMPEARLYGFEAQRFSRPGPLVRS
jgi:MEMO1 family protein